MGKPGSGKGTITDLIIKNNHEYKYININAGDLLRNEKETGSVLGNKISSIIDRGNLVPDSLIGNMIATKLNSEDLYNKNIIFDGYPRSVQQAKDLDDLINIDLVINLDCTDMMSIDRIMVRSETSNREDDSSLSIIKDRLLNYWKITEPVNEYYKKDNRFINIDSSLPIEDVYLKVLEYINVQFDNSLNLSYSNKY